MTLAIKSDLRILRAGLFICVLFLCRNANAQVVTEENGTQNENSVKLFADSRLSALTTFQEITKPVYANAGSSKNVSGSIHSAKGYRILIYSGIDRAKANSTKADFMRRHPGTRIYMTYALPQYRIKVGDYISRGEANEFYRQLSGIYSPCMVVPDIVEINTFRRNDQ
ncbi:MAG: SPOR domain-containing protein [Chitinophagaceae bacterium]|jgi:hypothetical protein